MEVLRTEIKLQLYVASYPIWASYPTIPISFLLAEGLSGDRWISLTRDDSFNWFWDDSVLLTWTNWYGSEPDNNPAPSKCVRLIPWTKWKWGDKPCSNQYHFVCQLVP